MNSNPDTLPVAPPVTPQIGLAVASLVLGILACVLSLFVIGALFGLVGLLLGFIHVQRKSGRNYMAWWGISLSIVSILASVAAGIVYYRVFQKLNVSSGATGALSQWEGVLAPDISVTTLDGKTIKLGDLKGKRVVLDFWATWCGPCVREIPHFIKLYNETSHDELMIVGISREETATVRSFVTKEGMNYPIAVARGFPSPYKDIQYIPTTFFIDRNGVIQSVAVGYNQFDRLKERALAGDYQGQPKPAPGAPPRIP
jgi:peroxiredoxin